jgi:hypothetical protein
MHNIGIMKVIGTGARRHLVFVEDKHEDDKGNGHTNCRGWRHCYNICGSIKLSHNDLIFWGEMRDQWVLNVQ